MAETLIEGEDGLFARITTPKPVEIRPDGVTVDRLLCPSQSGRFHLGDASAGWELEDVVQPGPAATPHGWAWDPWPPALRLLRVLVGCPWR